MNANDFLQGNKNIDQYIVLWDWLLF
jgi:hypothetical protein